jgi:hypothetical protein
MFLVGDVGCSDLGLPELLFGEVGLGDLGLPELLVGEVGLGDLGLPEFGCLLGECSVGDPPSLRFFLE